MKPAWALIIALCLAPIVARVAWGSSEWPASLLESFPRHVTDRDEPAELRAGRLRSASSAIRKAAAGDAYLAKALAIHGLFETHFARYVGEGRCHDGPKGSRCDEGRARTYFQVWETTCPKAWAEPQGSVAELEAAAVCAANILRAGRARCGTPEGMFAAMWGSGRCKLEKAAIRARAFEALR